jgi:hypothetical protein
MTQRGASTAKSAQARPMRNECHEYRDRVVSGMNVDESADNTIARKSGVKGLPPSVGVNRGVNRAREGVTGQRRYNVRSRAQVLSGSSGS